MVWIERLDGHADEAGEDEGLGGEGPPLAELELGDPAHGGAKPPRQLGLRARRACWRAAATGAGLDGPT